MAATIRYENITKLQVSKSDIERQHLLIIGIRKDYMEGKGLNSGNSYKAAFAAETEAYNTSESMVKCFYAVTCRYAPFLFVGEGL